jgi:hypothetical protein
MINNKFISLKSVIDDVFRDTKHEGPIDYGDMAYWAFECLGLLNQPLQFIRKVTGYKGNPNLDIQNYRAELPCDFYHLEQIAVNGAPARYATGTFHHLLSGSCCGVSTDASGADVFIDNFGNVFSPQSSSYLGSTSSGQITFDINNNYLTLSCKEGKVCIAYLAFPTDCDGYPEIPDEMSYKVAIKKYLMMKMSSIEWRKDPSNAGKRAIFEYDNNEWMWYAGKASSNAKMPSIDQMESLKNQLVRMIPNVNAHSKFFSDLGSPEQKRIV